jgi:hypothetical protein
MSIGVGKREGLPAVVQGRQAMDDDPLRHRCVAGQGHGPAVIVGAIHRDIDHPPIAGIAVAVEQARGKVDGAAERGPARREQERLGERRHERLRARPVLEQRSIQGMGALKRLDLSLDRPAGLDVLSKSREPEPYSGTV